MSSDNSIEIRITGAVDRSLEASTEAAIAQLAKIGEAAQNWSAQLDMTGAAEKNAAAWVQAADDASKAGAKAALDLANSSKQASDAIKADSAASANAQAKSWQTANREILSAEDSLVRDLFAKRQNLVVDLLHIGEHLVEQELASDLKYWTKRELLSLEGVEQEKTVEQGGLLQKLIFDQLKTTSTVTSQAAQSAAAATGAAVRTATQVAGDTQGLAAHAAVSSLTISHDAAQAAAGAYASASQVPVIGWLLGPVAAATAFGAVMAYDTVASAEGGQWKVGGAEQLTALHKDEMVWPGWAAHGARNMLQSFSTGDFAVPRGGDTIDRSNATTHNWNYAPTVQGVPERNVMDELRNNSGEFMSFVQG